MAIKKDTRLSTGRVATYAQKMKAAGHKQFSFFLSPQAHDSLKSLTISEQKLGATMGATAQILLNLLREKEFIYLALGGTDNLTKRMDAISQTIDFFEAEYKVIEKEYEAITDEAGKDYKNDNEDFGL